MPENWHDRYYEISALCGSFSIIQVLSRPAPERYCRVSNQKVRRDYYQAMEKVIRRHHPAGQKKLDKGEVLIN